MLSISLQQLITERIQREGAITFADYMRMALYEPEYGYYVSGPTRVGWQGDFYTSTDVTDLFAYCMGRQLQQMWLQLQSPVPFVVLEQGAGRGDLAQGVRKWAQQSAPDLFAALDYHIADIRTGQNAVPGCTEIAHHTERQPSASDPSEPQREQSSASPQPWRADPVVLLSNELVDAFPVHIVEKRGTRLYEVYVTVQQGQLCEVLDAPSSEEVACYLDTYKIPWHAFEDGWRAELNLDALAWMEQSARLLLKPNNNTTPRRSRKNHGFLLTIDYGDKAGALYTRDRRRGTLACYFRHQLTERPLLHPGQQDITAHVNFTALINEGRRQGLRLQTYTTQGQWLQALGIYEELARIRSQDYAIIDTARASDQGQIALLQWYNMRQGVSALTDPTGMGNFKVLILKA